MRFDRFSRTYLARPDWQSSNATVIPSSLSDAKGIHRRFFPATLGEDFFNHGIQARGYFFKA